MPGRNYSRQQRRTQQRIMKRIKSDATRLASRRRPRSIRRYRANKSVDNIVSSANRIASQKKNVSEVFASFNSFLDSIGDIRSINRDLHKYLEGLAEEGWRNTHTVQIVIQDIEYAVRVINETVANNVKDLSELTDKDYNRSKR